MSRAPGYLGNYDNRHSFYGAGSYGGLGLQQMVTAQKLTADALVKQQAVTGPMTVQAALLPTQDATASQLNRAHIDQAIQFYCHTMSGGKVSAPEAMERTRREALEVWGWAPSYATPVLSAAGAEVARAATSDFAPWSGCPRPMPTFTPTLPGAPAPSARTAPPPPPPPPTPTSAPSPAPPPPPPPMPEEPPPAPSSVVDPFVPDVPPQPGFAPDGSGTPLFTTRPEIFQPAPARSGPNWMLILGLGAAVVVGGYLLTRPKPRANPRRRRRRRRRR